MTFSLAKFMRKIAVSLSVATILLQLAVTTVFAQVDIVEEVATPLQNHILKKNWKVASVEELAEGVVEKSPEKTNDSAFVSDTAKPDTNKCPFPPLVPVDKERRIAAILGTDIPFSKRIAQAANNQCFPLLQAFRNREGITILRPDVRGESFDDPALQHIIGKCPNLHLNYAWITSKWPQEEWQALSFEDKLRKLPFRIAINNFELYDLHQYGAPEHTYVFFAENWGVCNGDISSRYIVFNTDTCEMGRVFDGGNRYHGSPNIKEVLATHGLARTEEDQLILFNFNNSNTREYVEKYGVSQVLFSTKQVFPILEDSDASYNCDLRYNRAEIIKMQDKQ